MFYQYLLSSNIPFSLFISLLFSLPLSISYFGLVDICRCTERQLARMVFIFSCFLFHEKHQGRGARITAMCRENSPNKT